MYEYLFILPIILALLLGSMSPGPSFLIIAQTAMSKSRINAISMALGLGVGAGVFALLASIGLYIIIESVPWVYAILKIVGGIYLCYLAFNIWKNSKNSVNPNSIDIKDEGVLKSFFVGLVTQLSNPKTAIIFGGVFAAFLPQNVPDYSYLILCIASFFVDAIWYILVASVLSTKRAQRVYSQYKKKIVTIFSGFMGLMGFKLATSI